MSDRPEAAVSHISYDCPYCGWAQSSEIGAAGEIAVECGGCGEILDIKSEVTIS